MLESAQKFLKTEASESQHKASHQILGSKPRQIHAATDISVTQSMQAQNFKEIASGSKSLTATQRKLKKLVQMRKEGNNSSLIRQLEESELPSQVRNSHRLSKLNILTNESTNHAVSSSNIPLKSKKVSQPINQRKIGKQSLIKE